MVRIDKGISIRPGVMVTTWKPFKGNKNVTVDRDLKQFKVSAADVVFDKDTCNNLFIWPKCKVSHLGSNNIIQMTE